MSFQQSGGSRRFTAALGSLLIKERLGTTDRKTVQQIAENPYLQYFLGFHEYKDDVPFDHTLMTIFRKRFTQEMLAEINEALVRKAVNEAESQTDWIGRPLRPRAQSTPLDFSFLFGFSCCRFFDETLYSTQRHTILP
jgi:hypothetical protein